jgi:hypothetical protein
MPTIDGLSEESLQERKENVLIHKLRAHCFSDAQILMIIETIETTCNHCWNKDISENKCWCINDD